MWILILFAHAGMMSDKDSMAMESVRGFTSEQVCMAAGNKAKELAKNTVKEVRFVCVKES